MKSDKELKKIAKRICELNDLAEQGSSKAEDELIKITDDLDLLEMIKIDDFITKKYLTS